MNRSLAALAAVLVAGTAACHGPGARADLSGLWSPRPAEAPTTKVVLVGRSPEGEYAAWFLVPGKGRATLVEAGGTFDGEHLTLAAPGDTTTGVTFQFVAGPTERLSPAPVGATELRVELLRSGPAWVGSGTTATVTTLTPDGTERVLAASASATLEARAAREKVVRAFYHDHPSLGDARGEQDLKGVDLGRPVLVVRFAPPAVMHQFVRASHRRPGNFFDPVGGQTATSLGVSGSGRVSVAFRAPAGEGLLSVAAPIRDDWTDSKNPVDTEGGGVQLVVDTPTRDRFQPQ